MNIQSIQQQNTQTIQKPQFKGAVDTTMRFLATNQAVGANGVDFCFMVSPRTASDFYKRGPAAGLETFRREIMGTLNDSCIGLFGAAAGWLVAHSLNKKFDFKARTVCPARFLYQSRPATPDTRYPARLSALRSSGYTTAHRD